MSATARRSPSGRRSPGRIYWRVIAPCFVAVTLILLSGCGTALLGAQALSDSISEGMADTSCERVPPFVRPPPVKVKSILLTSYIDHDAERDNFLLPLNILSGDNYEYGLTNGFAMLGGQLRRGFTFVEIEAPKTSRGSAMTRFVALGGDPHVRYLRFEFAAEGNAACNAFEKAVLAMGTPMLQQQLRSDVPAGMCIATFAEPEPTSSYALRVVDQPDNRLLKPQYSEPPALWELVDRRRDQVYAKLLRHMAVHGGSRPKAEIRRDFWSLIEVDRSE